MAKIIIPAKTEVVVASFGGVGTTFLINFIAKHRIVNHFDDEDGIKHLPVPSLSRNKNLKIIYVFGNPQLAAISLFRRDYHRRQSKKLRKCAVNAPPPIIDEMTLQQYAAKGVDHFYFREHFLNWHERYLSAHPTLFLRYETLFEHVEEIVDFLELPRESIVDFPRKKQRNSNMEQIDEQTSTGLNTMYGSFAEELSHLRDYEICQRSGTPFWNSPALSSPYFRAYRDQIVFESKEFLRKFAPNTYEKLRKMKKEKGD